MAYESKWLEDIWVIRARRCRKWVKSIRLLRAPGRESQRLEGSTFQMDWSSWRRSEGDMGDWKRLIKEEFEQQWNHNNSTQLFFNLLLHEIKNFVQPFYALWQPSTYLIVLNCHYISFFDFISKRGQ